jgi:F-box and leucine-rich repeat protein 10/11
MVTLAFFIYSSQLSNVPRLCRYCEACVQADSTHIMTFKTPARKSSRKRTQRDYANLNSGLGSDANRWTRMLETKEIKKDSFKRFKGSELEEWLEQDDDALREPIVIENPEGLGMTMPPNNFSVEDVAEMIGEDTPVEVIGEIIIIIIII